MQCLVDHDIDDKPEFCSQKTVIAKREMECCECSKTINPGDKFEMMVVKWHENYAHYKTCLTCLQISRRFCCNWYIGQMWEDIWDELMDNPDAITIGCLDGLSPEASSKMANILDDVFKEFEEDADE